MVLPKAILYKNFFKNTYMQIESKLGTGDQRSFILKYVFFHPKNNFTERFYVVPGHPGV